MLDRPPKIHVAVATVVGGLLRAGSFVANLGFPHGDVHLDAATAEQLARGRGFWTPWEEGAPFGPDEIGVTPETFGHPADQHGPLWPLLGAPIARLTGDGVLALQIVSWIFGVAAIPIAARLFARLSARAGLFAAWGCALALPLCDYSGNGSLYSAQACLVLALPLVAGELDRPWRAIASGVLLGLLFLLNYQCAVLIPAFAAAAIWAMGVDSGMALALAAAASLATVLPWFVRNAIVFGTPLYTTNPQYVVHLLRLTDIDLTGERPIVVGTAGAAEVLAGLQVWFPRNFAYWCATFHLALPAVALFAAGGFARMLGLRAGERRSVLGPMLLLSFVALFLMASLWPSPKARFVVPLVAIAAGVGMAELAQGARALPALAVGGASVLLGWYAMHSTAVSIPWPEERYLLPTLLLPLLAFWERGRRWLPWIAIAVLVLHGGFRVLLSVDRAAAARLLVGREEVKQLFGPPTPTFYDVMGGPIEESYEVGRSVELKRIGGRLRQLSIQRTIGPAELYAYWKGKLVTSPPFANRFDPPVLATTCRVFQSDGLVIPRDMVLDEKTRTFLYLWLGRMRATQIFGDEDGAKFYWAFQIPIQ